MKKIKILLVITFCVFIIWTVEMIVYATIHPHAKINELPNLKLHACGHIHYGHGIKVTGNTTFVNAATCTESYKAINKCFVVG